LSGKIHVSKEEKYEIAYFFGTDIGFKTGRGIIFGDIRFGGDTDFVRIGGADQFQRSLLFSLYIGCRIGSLTHLVTGVNNSECG
jgi:hypothetical protein